MRTDPIPDSVEIRSLALTGWADPGDWYACPVCFTPRETMCACLNLECPESVTRPRARIRTVCAWCEPGAQAVAGEVLSHGICPACAQRLRGEAI